MMPEVLRLTEGITHSHFTRHGERPEVSVARVKRPTTACSKPQQHPPIAASRKSLAVLPPLCFVTTWTAFGVGV